MSRGLRPRLAGRSIPVCVTVATMGRRMSRDQWRAFLAEGTRTAKLATVRTDGRPHVVPVWFVLDGDDVVFSTAATSVKGRALQRDPRACLCVDDQRAPYSFVMVEGTVTISADLDDMLDWAMRIGGRYMGAERAAEFGRRNAVEGELLVRLTPTNVFAQHAVAD
jgi:PPOX class probable F420-dependent enzyme